MNIKVLATAALFTVSAWTAQATTITFDQTDLRNGSVDAAQTTVQYSNGGLTLEAFATTGVIGVYQTDNPATNGDGLYIGLPTSGLIVAGNQTAPTSGSYGFRFGQDLQTLSFDFDWLSNFASPAEELSNFAADMIAITLGAGDFSGSGTSLNVTTQIITTSSARGSGTITYSGAPFNLFTFDHDQASGNIGFTVTELRATLAPVPLPAGLPMLVAALGGLALIRRRHRH